MFILIYKGIGLKVIHLVSGNDIGGAKTHLLTLLSALSKDIEVLFVCLESGVSYHAAVDAGINTISLEQKNRYDMSVVSKLTEIIKSGGYDILHCHGARANYVGIKLKKRISIPIITTIHSDYRHDFDNNILKKIIFTKINESSLKKLDYYLLVTRKFKDALVDAGFEEDKIRSVFNGIPTKVIDDPRSKAEICDAFNIPRTDISDKETGKKPVVIGIAARFHPIKGVDVFLEAVNELKIRGIKGFRVLLAGSGDEEEKYRAYVLDKGLSDCVDFLGFVDDMSGFYKLCDINVLTSHSEGFPYSLLEGGLRGIATVASAVGGIVDMIEDGIDGLLFPDSDFKSLADCLSRLLDDEDLRDKLGKTFRDKIFDRFSDDKMADTHIGIYEEILNKNRKRLTLCGYYGYKNSGDDAILAAIIKSFKDLDNEPDVVILSRRPEVTEEEYSCKSVNRFEFGAVWKLLGKTDVLVMGGGSLLQDKTSNRSLYYYLGLIHLALFRKVKVILYANGVGPIKSRLNRRLTAWTLNKIDALTIRERFSYDFVKSIGISVPEIAITADPVFNLNSPEDDRGISPVYAQVGMDPKKPIVGIMFRSWEGEDSYVNAVASVADAIYEKHGFQVVLLPMKYPADIKVSQAIASKMKSPSVVLEERYLPREVLAIIKDMDLVLGMRLHSVIYAGVYSIPFVGFKYDPKVAYYTEELGMPLVSNLEDIDVDEVLSYIDEILENYEAKRALLGKKAKLMKELARKNIEYIRKLTQS